MTRPILYAYPGACSRVTLSALEEAGLDFEDRWIDIAAMGQYSDAYLALNRKAKVPALVIGGTTLTENPAILHYLHVTNPGARLLPRAGDPLRDAQGLSDLIWCSAMLHPMVRQIRNPQRWTTGETAGVRADGLAKLAKEAAHIEARLAGSEWWYGADWSIVDVYLYWVTSTAATGGFPAGDYPAIAAHGARVRARPSFQRGLKREIAAVAREGMAIDPAGL